MVYYIYLLMTFTVSKSRETGNIWYTRRRQEKQIHNTIYGGHHYTQTNTNNVNTTQSSYKQLEVKLRFYPSGIGEISRFCQSCLGLFGFTADKDD
jgi:hypothetical protein